jgi:hypothetical protein
MPDIIHVDLDGFFIAVERQLDPRLADRPIVIGGQPSTRGVVVAACPEAKRLGVRAGLSLAIAASRCPQAAFLDGSVERYLEASGGRGRDPARPGDRRRERRRRVDRHRLGLRGARDVSDRRGSRHGGKRQPRPATVCTSPSGCGSASRASSASRCRAAWRAPARRRRSPRGCRGPRASSTPLPGYEARLLAPLDVGLLPDLPAGHGSGS